MYINAIEATGSIGASPEIRYLPTGLAVATFNLCVKTPSNQNGDWIRVKSFGKIAENAAKYLSGKTDNSSASRVTVRGSIKLETWINKNTNTEESAIIVLANRLDFQSAKKG